MTRQVALAAAIGAALFAVASLGGLADASGLEWAAAIVVINLSASLLISFFRSAGWDRAARRALILDAVSSLGGFAPLLARPPAGGLDIGNLMFVLFLLSKGWLLVWFTLANSERFARTPVRVWIVAVSLLLYAGAVVPVSRRSHAQGDEPHYLLATHSLLADGDLDLKNNYRNLDYQPFYPVELELRHALVNARNEDVPAHDVGVSVFLLPGYALGDRRGAMIELAVIAAVLALGIYELARGLGASRVAAVRAWGLFAFVSPLLVYSSQIYPE
ncbi:MAG: hypothetical protein M3542_09630, partial [Acidobacteriota bacterium]|nr:hypothetical protein [Acidobacteriota bacterium]MDQ5873558.1 hypothetical protein [Acidobacteriota bacterium]